MLGLILIQKTGAKIVTIEKPEIVEDEHLDYLDDLRESGVTNMWGAPAFLEDRYDITPSESIII